MFQTIQGRKVYVVEFKTMPKLPITGLTHEEETYQKHLSIIAGNRNGLLCGLRPTVSPYAEALTAALGERIITEPGKYAIYVDSSTRNWEVFRVIE